MTDEKIILELQGVCKKFDDSDYYSVEDFNLKIKEGEFVTFLGPSGCGKTTTLRMIAGFEKPTKGSILMNGKDIAGLPPHKRPLNTVFQRYALFSHLDVYNNVAFGLKLKKVPYDYVDKKGNKKTKFKRLSREIIDSKVRKALKIVDLEEFESRDISKLSGGQQQRVAIARAIVNEPKILLLDEPLGALDLKMRKEMQLELKAMHKKLNITFIYVTHDQEEALTMSDTIVVMNDGQIQQVGTPIDIYNEPKNAFVADFIGESNIYVGTMTEKLQVKFLNNNWKCVDDFPINEKVDVVVRPEDIKVHFDKKEGCRGKLVSKIFKGIHYQYVAMIGKNEVTIQSTEDYEVGSEIRLSIEPDLIQIMKRDVSTNLYTDAWIDRSNNVHFAGTEWKCNITQLLENSHVDDDGYLVDKEGKKYDLNDFDVKVNVDMNKITISDNLDEGNITGQIIQTIWKGDHYQAIVRTEDEEDFIVNTEYTWNDFDTVSVSIKPEDIILKAKGDISKNEI